jgi:hypothetical protein
MDALIRQTVEVGRLDIRIAGKPKRLRAPLVRDDHKDIGLGNRGTNGEPEGEQEERKSEFHEANTMRSINDGTSLRRPRT